MKITVGISHNGVYHRFTPSQIKEQKRFRAWQSVQEALRANNVHEETKKILKLSEEGVIIV